MVPGWGGGRGRLNGRVGGWWAVWKGLGGWAVWAGLGGREGRVEGVGGSRGRVGGPCGRVMGRVGGVGWVVWEDSVVQWLAL